MVKIHHFKFQGKRYAAAYNMNALDRLAEMAGEAADGESLDVHTLMKICSTRYGMIKALAVLIQEGERIEGRESDIDEAWLRENLSPAEGMWLQHKLAAIFVEGMRMETSLDADEEVDEVLEEIKKKVIEGSSPTEPSEPGE